MTQQQRLEEQCTADAAADVAADAAAHRERIRTANIVRKQNLANARAAKDAEKSEEQRLAQQQVSLSLCFLTGVSSH